MPRFDGRPELEQLLEIAYRIALRWCRSPADADDLAQEALLRFTASDPPPANPTAWLSVVVRRLSNRQRLRNLARRDAESAYLERQLPARVDIDLVIELTRVMSRLNRRHRRVIKLLLQGAQSSEIAAAFGCKVRDVGQIVARARRGARRVRDDLGSERKTRE